MTLNGMIEWLQKQADENWDGSVAERCEPIIAALKAGQAMRDSLYVDEMIIDRARWVGVEVQDKDAAYLACTIWDQLVQPEDV